AMLIEASPKKFYKPPYVGVRGWVGIELARISDKELASHIRQAWLLIAPKTLAAKLEEKWNHTLRSLTDENRNIRTRAMDDKIRDAGQIRHCRKRHLPPDRQ